MVDHIRIVIADDTDISREGMARILAAEPDIEIIGEGTTPSETVQKVHDLRPDVLLLDMKWFQDEGAGIDVTRRLTAEVPETKIVAITIYPHAIEPARNAGALVAMTKDVPKRQLVEEIRSVHRLPPPRPAEEKELPETPIAPLSDRELQVLALLAEDKTDKEIAEALTIAESTAKNHVAHILQKLHVRSRTGAVSAGYRLGLVGGEDDR